MGAEPRPSQIRKGLRSRGRIPAHDPKNGDMYWQLASEARDYKRTIQTSLRIHILDVGSPRWRCSPEVHRRHAGMPLHTSQSQAYILSSLSFDFKSRFGRLGLISPLTCTAIQILRLVACRSIFQAQSMFRIIQADGTWRREYYAQYLTAITYFHLRGIRVLPAARTVNLSTPPAAADGRTGNGRGSAHDRYQDFV